MASSAESPFFSITRQSLACGSPPMKKTDAVRIVLEHLFAAAADEQEGFPARRLSADHIKGLFRHVDLERIGKSPDAAGGKEVDRLLVHPADQLLAVALRDDLRLDGVLIVELDAEFTGDHVGYVVTVPLPCSRPMVMMIWSFIVVYLLHFSEPARDQGRTADTAITIVAGTQCCSKRPQPMG